MEPGSPSLLHANQRCLQSPVGSRRWRSQRLRGRRRPRPEVSAHSPDLCESIDSELQTENSRNTDQMVTFKVYVEEKAAVTRDLRCAV